MLERIPFAKAAKVEKANWKTKRRIMRTFKLNEISAVDKPAQEGARFSLAKRAPDDTGPSLNDAPLVLAKAAFAEEFADRKTEQAVCRAWYDAMDDRWIADEAFRATLEAGGESGVEEYVAAIKVMANRAVSAVTTARADTEAFKAEITKALAEPIKFEKKEPTTMIKFNTRAALLGGVAAFLGGDKTVEKSTIQKDAIDLDAVDCLTGELALSPPDPRVAKMETELAVLKLAPALKAHYDGLDATAQAAFLAKDTAAQTAEVDGLTKGDPVVYTCSDGTQIMKSDGKVALMMAKQNDATNKRLDAIEKSRTEDKFDKQASTDFPHLATKSTVATLKAIDGLDDADKAEVLKSLTVANKAAASKFRQVGKRTETQSYAGDEGEGEDVIETMAKAYQAAHPDKTYEQSYTEVLKSAEGRAAFNKSVGFEPA